MIVADKKDTGKVFFPNLDGLRSVAFLMVFLNHTLFFTLLPYISNNSFYTALVTTVTYGGAGVSIFFVLSGFLITFLLLSEEGRREKINVPFFYVRRILRIWPLYYLVIILTVTIFPYLKRHLGQQTDLGLSSIYYYTFLSNFDVIRISQLPSVKPEMMSGITWSVAVEEQFYLLWPLLFIFIPKKLRTYIFVLIILTGLIFRFFYRDNIEVLLYHSLSVCADLALGGLMAYCCYYSQAFVKFFSTLPRRTIMVIYLLGFGWLFLGDQHLASKTLIATGRLVNILFFAFVIVEQNYSRNSFYKFSQFKLLSFWGKYTYGLYLLHPIAIWIIEVVFYKVLHLSGEKKLGVSLFHDLLAFFLTLALAYVSYEYYEKRFLKFKDKFSFTGKEKSPVVPQPRNEIQSNDAGPKR